MTHTVTVTTRLDDEGTEDERRRVDTVTFVCDYPADADCRTYPNCDCERFTHDENDPSRDEAGHVLVAGQRCWLADWFDADGAVYVGDDYDDMRDDCVPPINRSGRIEFRGVEGWPEWWFAAAQ